MPYIIVHSGDGYCIHKQDEAGQPSGDPLGCHPSEQEAQDQVAALYANEPQAPAEVPPQAPPEAKAVVAQQGEEWCVFEAGENGEPTGDAIECFASEEEARASLDPKQEVPQGEVPQPEMPKAAKWMTLAQVKTVCVPCAEKMAEAGIDRVNLAELSPEARAVLEKAAVIEGAVKADYPWDQCISEQLAQYGDEETARRVCGFIRQTYGKSDAPFDMAQARAEAEAELGIKPPVKSQKAGYADIKVAEWVAVGKATEKGKARVLMVPFGGPDDKDADGQWFTEKTDLMLQKGDTRPILYYHGMGPNGSPLSRPEPIGMVTVDDVNEDGQWGIAEVDESKTLGRRIWDGIKRGIVRASSGAIAHLARIARSGEILTWPVGELSLIDVGMGREPANFNAVALPIKSVYKDAELELPEAFRQVLADSAEAAE